MGPTTDIEIMSNAAVLLGKSPFATIQDSDEFAVSLQKFYDMLVPSELSKSHWKFAKKYIQLALTSSEVDFAQWDSAYQLPADYLMAVRVYPDVLYEIFGDKLYTTTTGELKMEYNYNVPVTRWSNPFKEYMVYSLAANMAMSVAENLRLSQMLEQKRHQARSEAMWVDSQSAPTIAIQSKPWIEARSFASGDLTRFNRG